jgi:hypothetical protein
LRFGGPERRKAGISGEPFGGATVPGGQHLVRAPKAGEIVAADRAAIARVEAGPRTARNRIGLRPFAKRPAVLIAGLFEPALADGVLFRAKTGPDANIIAAVQAGTRLRLLCKSCVGTWSRPMTRRR